MGQKTDAVILARVSSKAQEDEGYSLDSQVKLLQSYCETKNLRVVKVFKIAETASKEQSRKVFHELLEHIQANGIFHLVVEKTDRLTRNMRDAVAIDDWLQSDKDRMLHAVKESLMLHKESKSDVKFMWNIHLAVANKYTNNLREEAMKGWAEKLAQGWLPAVPPPGYITIAQNGKRIHVPDPNTKKLVRKAFELYLDPSHSIASVAERLKAMGLVTRKGRPYAKSKIQKMLTNPFYIGINRFNGKDYPGAQKPLITKSLFQAVQEKLSNKRPMKQFAHNPVFKNMMYCQDCSGTITWEKHGEVYYGACQRRSDACMGKKYIREDKADEQIRAMLEKLVCPSKKMMQWVLDTMRSRELENVTNREEVISALQSKIARLERMEETLYDDKLAGLISPEKYLTKRQQLIQEKNDLSDQLDRLDESSALQAEYGMTLLELSQKAAEIYPNKTIEQKRLILSEIFHSITASGDTLSVKLTKLAEVIAEKVVETNDMLNGPKGDERELENDQNNGGETKKTNLQNEIRSSWLGRRDSNPRMLGPKPSALPLGDSPMCNRCDYTKIIVIRQLPRGGGVKIHFPLVYTPYVYYNFRRDS